MTDKIEVTLNPRLIPMFGKALYRNNLLKILVRELIQNSRDACLSTGCQPDVHVTIVKQGYRAEVTCEDNGGGMTEDIIRHAFFELGGSGKLDDLLAIGGFGVAALSVIGNQKWWIKSQDNYVNSDNYTLEKTEEFLTGTKVWVTVDSDVYHSTLQQTILWVVLNDFPVWLTVIDDNTVIFDNPAACLGNLAMPMREIDPKKISDTLFPGMLHRMGSGLTLPTYGQQFGMNVFRLNGMVQYISQTSTLRVPLLFFDFETRERPGGDTYPFTMSREGLRSDFSHLIDFYIRMRDTDALSTNRAFQKPEDPVLKVKSGYLVQGTRGMREGKFVEGQAMASIRTTISEDEIVYRLTKATIDASTGLAILDTGKAIVINLTDEEEHEVQEHGEIAFKIRNKISLLIKGYRPSGTEQAREDARLLRAWELVLRIACRHDEFFGLGLMNYATAERCIHEKVLYYMINPREFDNLKSIPTKALMLWDTACHEAAHREYLSHDEYWSNNRDKIVAETADDFLKNHSRIMELLN